MEESPDLILSCHAFGEKLILAGLPGDLDEAELMRFFSKQGASGTIVAHARTCSFASVSFQSTTDVAKFLGRTAHTFADDKDTRIARLLYMVPSPDLATLPALPAPALAQGEEPGSLLVVWSPLVLAVAYAVELRQSGPWSTVEVAATRPGAAPNRFDSSCSSCKVTGLLAGATYQARVSYFTECGTRSEASEPSVAEMPSSDGKRLTATAPPPPMQLQQPLMSTPVTLATDGRGTGLGAARGFEAPLFLRAAGSAGSVGPLPPASALGAYPLSLPTVASTYPEFATAPPLGLVPGIPPVPPAWPSWSVGPEGVPVPSALPPLPMIPAEGFVPPPMPSYPSASWRSVTGLVVPPPAAPELRQADEFGFAVSVQWPAVLQAAAYVVELREAGSTAFERFVRSAPEAKLGTVVELRVGGLRPGPPPGRVYMAQVRTVGTDSFESVPSPPGWSPHLPPLTAGAAAHVIGAKSCSGLSASAPSFLPSASLLESVKFEEGASAEQGQAGNEPWVPPPWLGAASAAQSGVGAALGNLNFGVGDAEATSVSMTWGAPGGPPPPPAAPPLLGGARHEETVPEVSGTEECLILD